MNPIQKVNQVQATSPLFSGLIYSLIVMIIGTIMTSLLLLFSETKESSLPVYTYIIHGLSAFVGGVVSGKRTGKKGWYYGGILGIVYSLLVFIIGFLAYDTGLSLQSLVLLGVSFAAGALGGILGVNSKK